MPVFSGSFKGVGLEVQSAVVGSITRMMNMKKKSLLIKVIILVLLIIVLPYVRVEILTAAHRQQFLTEYKQMNMIAEIAYLKILHYTETKADVYYVLKDHVAGVTINFMRHNGVWEMTNWRTVWSESGSADELMWPFYR